MNRTKYLFLSAVLFFTFAAGACAQSDSSKQFTPQEFSKVIASDTSLVILDVRNPAELEGPLGKIDKVINIPLPELEKRAGELDKIKDKKIAVICRTGHRSSIATKILLEKGFNAINVEGGMTQYRNLEKTKQ